MRKARISILLLLIILLSIGTIMIYSSSSINAWKYQDDSFFYLKRHLVFLCIGFVFMFFAMALELSQIRKWSKIIFFFSLILLVLTLFPGIGRQVAGAKRWLKLGPIGFQPSELVKLTFLIYLADFLSRKQKIISNFFHGLLPVLIGLAIPTLLILMQPDLGTAISFVCVTFIMLFISGLSIKYFAGAFLLGMPVLYFLIFSVPYRRARIFAFLNPWADPKGAGFQIIQSQIALGSGGLFGLGLGQGKQKLFYLPAAHTDFIFSVIGEEIGVIGGVVVVMLFMFLLLQMIKIVRLCNDDFNRFLTMGIVILMGLEIVINMGVSLGLMPTKGLPLPFISYGGSALVFDMAAIGLLLNASRRDELQV